MQLEEVAKALKELGHPTRFVHFQASGQSGRAGPACWRLAKAARHSRLDPEPSYCGPGFGRAGQAEPGEPHPAVRLSIRGAGRDHRVFPRGVLCERQEGVRRSTIGSGHVDHFNNSCIVEIMK